MGSIANGIMLGVPGLIAQGVGLTAGRAVDSVTGRRSLVNLYKKQNLGTDTKESIKHLPSQFEINREAAAQAKAIKAAEAEEAKFNKTIEQMAAKASDTVTRMKKVKGIEQAKAAKDAERTRAKAKAENDKFNARQARAAQIAQREADRQAKAAESVAAKQAADATKSERDKFKMLQNAARGVAALKRQAEKEKTQAAPSKKVSPADGTPKDAAGRKIMSEKLYNARKREIVALEETAKQKASKHSPEAKKIIEEAVTKFNTEGRGKKTHKHRVEIYKAALNAATTLEQREAVKDALKPLAEVYGSVE
jgi:hypothetical protein